MDDLLTSAWQELAGTPAGRVVVLTSGAPACFLRHFSISSLLRFAFRSPEAVGYIKRLVRSATETPLAQGLALEGNLFRRLCDNEPSPARMRSYGGIAITGPSRSIAVESGSASHG